MPWGVWGAGRQPGKCARRQLVFHPQLPEPNAWAAAALQAAAIAVGGCGGRGGRGACGEPRNWAAAWLGSGKGEGRGGGHGVKNGRNTRSGGVGRSCGTSAEGSWRMPGEGVVAAGFTRSRREEGREGPEGPEGGVVGGGPAGGIWPARFRRSCCLLRPGTSPLPRALPAALIAIWSCYHRALAACRGSLWGSGSGGGSGPAGAGAGMGLQLLRGRGCRWCAGSGSWLVQRIAGAARPRG